MVRSPTSGYSYNFMPKSDDSGSKFVPFYSWGVRSTYNDSNVHVCSKVSGLKLLQMFRRSALFSQVVGWHSKVYWSLTVTQSWNWQTCVNRVHELMFTKVRHGYAKRLDAYDQVSVVETIHW
ncbi:hypothetical protein L873DRAFT_1795782 [Choiromyces venosus 120613-1]|uniref:Uncharacterized protein n=1 Tax=Choiromyces venosus 120613-1 TaxID=1336337 RepID=A0A3N4IVD3_9PEZI|nr:hypothetical protein L873DRAFT_1795782 [Choiromyces venosus 120613-1]